MGPASSSTHSGTMERRSESTTTSASTPEGIGDPEDGAQGGALAADTVDLGIGEADALELVARPDEQDALDVVGRLGVHDHPAGAVGRAGVRVDEHGPQVREVLDETGLRGTHHVADGRRVPVARDADHDVGAAELLHRAPERRWQSLIGHPRPPYPDDRPMDRPNRAVPALSVAPPTLVMARHSGVRSPGM